MEKINIYYNEQSNAQVWSVATLHSSEKIGEAMCSITSQPITTRLENDDDYKPLKLPSPGEVGWCDELGKVEIKSIKQ